MSLQKTKKTKETSTVQKRKCSKEKNGQLGNTSTTNCVKVIFFLILDSAQTLKSESIMLYLDKFDENGYCKRQQHRPECGFDEKRDLKRNYRATTKEIAVQRPDKDTKQVLDSTDDKLDTVFDKDGTRRPMTYLRNHDVSKRKEKFAIYNVRKSGNFFFLEILKISKVRSNTNFILGKNDVPDHVKTVTSILENGTQKKEQFTFEYDNFTIQCQPSQLKDLDGADAHIGKFLYFFTTHKF